MRAINSYKLIKSYFKDNFFKLDVWEQYVYEISENLSELCKEKIGKYNFKEQVLPIVNAALNNEQKMLEISQNFDLILDELSESIKVLTDEEIDVDIILYLGLCNGAGWATMLDNKNTILLGLEKIIELDWCDMEKLRSLIFHELGHIWHNLYGNLYFPTNNQREQSMLQLYQEGVAMVCEQILSKSEDFHQDKNGWLDWCEKNENEIKKEYVNRLKNYESTQDFFGDWVNYNGYSDVGYYLGRQFITYLQKEYSIVEIANLKYEELFDKYITFSNI